MEVDIVLSKGKEVKGWIMKPSGEAKKVIIFFHGIGEHFGRYEEWSKRFLEKDHAVIGFDLPGHGRSPGKRGHIENLEVINEITDKLIGISNEWFPGKPVVLYGQSMGALIILNWMSDGGKGAEAGIISSPWLRLSFVPPKSKIILAKVATAIMPAFTQRTGLVTEHITSNSDLVEKYRKDPLVHGMISAALFSSTYYTGEKLLAGSKAFTNRVLVMHGSADKLTSVEASEEFAASAPNATFRLWEGGFHELHNEPFKDEVFDYIMGWLDSKKS